MIVDHNMLKSTVAPVPTVLPGPTVTYVKASDTGHRTLW